MTRSRQQPVARTVLLLTPLLSIILAGCSDVGVGSASTRSPTAAAGARLPAEAAHVHGVVIGRDNGRDNGTVLVATHNGLFRMSGRGVDRVGPAIDLMGFAQAPDGDLLASGHPDAATQLPSPAGLMSSTDGGRTWEVRSRGGESDFHALTAAGAGAVGFDGTLRATRDRQSWSQGSIDVPPFALAADPSGRTVLATTEQGLRRSTDNAKTFTPVADAPLLMLAASAGARSFLGITPEGHVWASDDGGLTWARRGRVASTPQALAARGEQVAVVADQRVFVSHDRGLTFTAIGS